MDKELFKTYVLQLVNDIPQPIYEGAASIFCIGTVIFFAWKGWKKGRRWCSLLAWIEYVVLIYCSTVFCRVTNEARQYDWHPFWSYRAIGNGRVDLMAENIMNVVVFVPVGLLLAVSVLRLRWWMMFLIGMSISLGVEVLQFIYMKGFSEVDDIIHNAVGCLIGILLYLILKKTCSYSMRLCK